MTEEELKAIEARANAASDAPWTFFPPHDVENSESETLLAVHSGNPADGEFAARARFDIPALLAEVRRLRTICDDALWLASDGDVQEAKKRLTAALYPSPKDEPLPRYSTDAVDELLSIIDFAVCGTFGDTARLNDAVAAVLASREPRNG